MTKKTKIFLTSFFILIYISNCIFKVEMYMNKYVTDEKTKKIEIFVIEKFDQDEKKVSYLVKLNSVKNTNKYKDKFILNIYIDQYTKKESNDTKQNLKEHLNYNYGDVLYLTGKIVIPEILGNPYEFNYKKYLNSKNIYGLIISYNQVEKLEKEKGILGPIYKLREYISKTIEKSMVKKENATLLKSMIYGDKRELTDETKKTFEFTGTSHILTASGANIGTVVLIISFFMRKLKIHEYTKTIIISTVVILFIGFAGFEHSIVRAGLSIITALIFGCINKNTSNFNKLLIVFATMFYINPAVIFSTGAILSFLATFGILVFYRKIMSTFEYIFRVKLRAKKQIVLRLILKITSITIAVQITILPMQISLFNNYSLITLPANIISGIISDLIRILGTIGIIMSFIPKLAILIFKFTEPLIVIFNIILKLFYKISLNMKLATPSTFSIVIYYTYILAIFLQEKLTIKQYNQALFFNEAVEKTKGILTKTLIIVFVLSIIYTTYFENYIYFFNVKQGDMSFVSYKGTKILIDMGSTTEGLSYNVLDTFLKKKNINKIDVVIISHFHLDHVNGLEELIQKYKVGAVIFAAPKEDTLEYTKFKQYMRHKDIREIMVERGDEIEIRNIKINIYSPYKKKVEDKDIQNANSIVFTLSLENKTDSKQILYMGDATINTELNILKYNEASIKKDNFKNISILKVGHHGSKTSTSPEFLKTVLPNFAVISCGNTIYRHPHNQTLDILNRFEVKTYVTRFNGCVKVNI